MQIISFNLMWCVLVSGDLVIMLLTHDMWGCEGSEMSKDQAYTGKRFSVTVPEELFQLIEDFRFENRYSSRNEAAMALLKAGMEAMQERGDCDD